MMFHSVPLSLLDILSEYFDDFILVLVLRLNRILVVPGGNPPPGSFQDDVEIKHLPRLLVDVLSVPAVFGRKHPRRVSPQRDPVFLDRENGLWVVLKPLLCALK
jgi:hypothetical protein